MNHGKNTSIRERVKSLSPEKQEELKQYVESIKEIKRKINEMLSQAEKVDEVGGNMMDLHLDPED